MAKTLTLHTRVEPDVKEKADTILKQLGISTTEAINMFLNQIIMNNGLPFEVKIPNEETEKVFQATDMGENLKSFDTVDAMFKELGI